MRQAMDKGFEEASGLYGGLENGFTRPQARRSGRQRDLRRERANALKPLWLAENSNSRLAPTTPKHP